MAMPMANKFMYFSVLFFLIEKRASIILMLLQLHYYLPLAKGWAWQSIKRFFVYACWSHFYINLHISFISEDIFAENVGNENMSVKILSFYKTKWLP